MNHRRRMMACLLAALLLLVGDTSDAKKPPKDPPPPPPVAYSQIVLPSVSGVTSSTEAWDVNNEGMVVGRARFVDDEWSYALFWYPDFNEQGDLIGYQVENLNESFQEELTIQGLTLGEAGCINDSGLIAGSTHVSGPYSDATWGTGIFLGDVAGTILRFLEFPYAVQHARALDINDDDIVVGYFKDMATERTHGFAWDTVTDGLMIVDVASPVSFCELVAIDNGMLVDGVAWYRIVGRTPDYSRVFESAIPRPSIPFEPFEQRTLGPEDYEILFDGSDIPWDYGHSGINDNGTVVGAVYAKGKLRPARSQSGVWEYLSPNRKDTGWGADINSRGDICGDTHNDRQGFVFLNSVDPQIPGSFWNLNELGAPLVQERDVFAISNSYRGFPFGAIVGKVLPLDYDYPPMEDAIILIPSVQED